MDTPTAGSTRERLLDVAERRFGLDGYAGTSLRAVTDEAVANIAAVNYHFGSKEALLRATLARAQAPVDADREHRLDTLESVGPPAPAELIRAFVEPALELLRYGERGRLTAHFLGRTATDPSSRISALYAAQTAPTGTRYLTALHRAVRGVPPEFVTFGYRSMLGLIAFHQSPGTLGPAGLPPTSGREAPTERLVTFLIAGFAGGLRA